MSDAELKKQYNAYKKQWIADNVDDVTMGQTFAKYHEEAADTKTFEEYVTEYGFAGDMRYDSFDEWQLKREMAQTAYDEAAAVYRMANGLDDYDNDEDYAEEMSDEDYHAYMNHFCRTAIRNLFRVQFEDEAQKAEAVGKLLEDFGIDRMQWVLAFSIQANCEHFNEAAQKWASTIVPENYPMEEAQSWIIPDHFVETAALAEKIARQYAGLHLLDASKCESSLKEQNVTSRLLILNPKVLVDSSKTPYAQYIYVTDSPEHSHTNGQNEYGEGIEVSLTDEQIEKYAEQFRYPVIYDPAHSAEQTEEKAEDFSFSQA